MTRLERIDRIIALLEAQHAVLGTVDTADDEHSDEAVVECRDAARRACALALQLRNQIAELERDAVKARLEAANTMIAGAILSPARRSA